jgi:SanA protein
MDAAEALYKNNKVSKFILSGDNRRNDYNEPKAMREELVKRGIPDSCLFSDYAGTRTFDSMLRCKQIFGQDTIMVVSQEFHTARAVFIGRKNGLVACGFNAQEVSTKYSFKTKVREFFSRIKCILDIYLLGTKPKHLGSKEDIN